jgi:hypothetical protein
MRNPELCSLNTLVTKEAKEKFLQKIREEGYTIQEALSLLIEKYIKEN